MKVYITRHGETEYSLNNIVCGSTDCELTDTGRAQARRLADEILERELDIGLIYTSPLIRARETADIIAAAIGVPCVIDTRLREQDCGAFEGVEKRDSAFFNEQRRNFANRLRGGESVLMLAQRIYNFLDELRTIEISGSPLIVAHGCACGMINSYFNEPLNDEFFAYSLANCALAEFEL